MKYQLHFITMFVTLVQVIQLKFTDNQMFLNENKSLYQMGANDYIFESDESDIKRINKIDFKVIQNSFTIKAFDSEQLIHIIFLHSITFEKQIAYCVCQLLKTKKTYCISCIDGIFISPNNDNDKQLIYHQNFKKIKILLQSERNEQCKELFPGSTNEVIVYCQTFEALKLYKINLKEQISIVRQVDGNFSNCQEKFFNINQSSYLAIYNCENWQIFEISQRELIVVNIDQKIHEEINILNEIYVCQKFLYFVVNKNYYKFKKPDKQFIFIEKQFGESIIKGLAFNQFCNIFYQVVENEQMLNSQIQINFETAEIYLDKKQNFELHILNQFILLKQENHLRLIFCGFLNQTYEVNTSKLQFINQVIKYGSIEMQLPNLFFSIDEISSSAIFYEYFHLPTFIQPKKKFVFTFLNFTIFTKQDSDNILVSEIFYQSQMKQVSSLDMYTINKCKPIQKETLYKYYNFIQQTEYIVSFEQQKQIVENITNEEDISELFPYLSSEKLQNIILIDDPLLNNNPILNHNLVYYLTQEQFYIYSISKESIIYSKNRMDNLIFSNKEIAIVNLKINQIISLLIFEGQVYENQINLNKSIETINECLSYLIIKFSDQSYLIFDIEESRIIQIEKEIDQQLPKFGVPICYFGKQQIKLIQYHNCVLIKTKYIFKIFQIEEVQILRISRSQMWYLINTIHQQKDLFINYYFNGRQLIRDKEIILKNVKFIRPLIQSRSQNYISIAQKAQEGTSIVTIDLSEDLQILNIKKTNNLNFAQLNKKLFYFDLDNHYRAINLEEYFITISNHTKQKNFIDSFKIMINLKNFAISQDIFFEKQINLKIINQCYELFSEKNNVQISKNEKLNLSKLISGPFQNLALSDYNYYKIIGPFKIQQSLKRCLNDFSNICKKDYAITHSNSQQNYFDFYCIEFLFEEGVKNFCYSEQQIEIYDVRLIIWSLGHNSQISLNLIQNKSAYFLQMFLIDQQNKLLKETHYIKIKELNFTQEDFFQNQKVENQILAFTFSNQQIRETYLIYVNFDEGNYLFDELQSENFDICFISTSSETYIIMQIFDEIQIHLLSFSTSQKQTIKSFILGQEFKNFLEQRYLFEKNDSFLNSFISVKIKITSCNIYDNYLEFDLFFILKIFSIQVKVTYNIQTDEKYFKFGKNIRNPVEETYLNLNYLDSSILVMDSVSHHYFYDIESTKSMHDYNGKFEQQGIKIFQVDNTDYLCIQNQNIEIVQFGYWIEQIGIYNQSQEKIYLIASNEVSELQIEILPKMEEPYQTFTLFIKIFLFICTMILLVLIYLIRRNQLMKGQKQFRIQQ